MQSVRDLSGEKRFKKLWIYHKLKNKLNFFGQSIVGIKKGFYICTRLARKRVNKSDKKVHTHIELTA